MTNFSDLTDEKLNEACAKYAGWGHRTTATNDAPCGYEDVWTRKHQLVEVCPDYLTDNQLCGELIDQLIQDGYDIGLSANIAYSSFEIGANTQDDHYIEAVTSSAHNWRRSLVLAFCKIKETEVSARLR
jgi:hypothetical protein